MMHARRSMALLLTASVSAGAGMLYMGEDPQLVPPSSNAPRLSNSNEGKDTSKTDSMEEAATTKPRRRPLRAITKKDLGWEQSLARDLACWISAASVYTASQVLHATAPSSCSTQPHDKPTGAPPHELLLTTGTLNTSALPVSPPSSTPGLYHSLLGWIQELDPQATGWNADRVLQSTSFSVLLNAVSASNESRHDLEADLVRAVGLLATNAQCAAAIATRATRYGKLAMLTLAHHHSEDTDTRVGEALRRLVRADTVEKKLLDQNQIQFGPANVLSLVALAVSDDVPDAYMEFALWALAKAASPDSLSTTYTWRKTLFGDDAAGKTRRKLIANDKLWTALDKVHARPHDVQRQAARLLDELSSSTGADIMVLVSKLHQHPKILDSVVQWMRSDDTELATVAFRLVANLSAIDVELRNRFVSLDTLDTIRGRVLVAKKSHPRLIVELLRAVRSLAQQTSDEYLLDQDALSFVSDADEEHPLHHDDLVHVLKHHYVDGWIELFTAFVHNRNDAVRKEAAMCLEQMALLGTHRDQVMQEWLIAVLDGVLEKVPASIAAGSTSIRAARSRTRPLVGQTTSTAGFASSHTKALRALAFVAGRKEYQEEFARRGGVSLLKLLLQSENLNVQRETARVLANLFTCDAMDRDFATFASTDEHLTTALTTALNAWTRSEDLMLRSLAHRARSNRRYQHNRLHHDDESDVKYLDGVHPLHFSTSPTFGNGEESCRDGDSTRDYDVDIVFIHGLLGCPYETWICGDDDKTVWAEKWLLNDLKDEGLNPRVLSIGYDSQLLASKSTWRPMGFQETSQEVLKKLRAARVGENGRSVVFVTHSLGGVVLKQVLLESNELATESTPNSLVDSLNGVVFYGVPHHGSPVAQTIQALRPRSLGIQQHPVTEHLHGTPHLKMLNEWCASMFQEKSIPAISIGESVPCRLPLIGMDALVVPKASANPGFGEFICVENVDHVDVCKPQSKDDVRYTLTKSFITRHVPVAKEEMMNVE